MFQTPNAAGALELLTVLEDQETAEQQLGEPNSQGEAEQSGTAGRSAAAAIARRQQLEDVLRLRFGYHLFEGMSSQSVGTLVQSVCWYSLQTTVHLAQGVVQVLL